MHRGPHDPSDPRDDPSRTRAFAPGYTPDDDLPLEDQPSRRIGGYEADPLPTPRRRGDSIIKRMTRPLGTLLLTLVLGLLIMVVLANVDQMVRTTANVLVVHRLVIGLLIAAFIIREVKDRRFKSFVRRHMHDNMTGDAYAPKANGEREHLS